MSWSYGVDGSRGLLVGATPVSTGGGLPTGGNVAVVGLEGGVAVVGLEGGVAVSAAGTAPLVAGVSVVVALGGITPASAAVCVTSGGGGGVATSNGTVVTGGGNGDGGGGKAVMGGGGVATGNGTVAGGGAGGMSGGAAVIGGTAGCADGTVVGATCPSATGDPMTLRQMTDETARATPPMNPIWISVRCPETSSAGELGRSQLLEVRERSGRASDD